MCIKGDLSDEDTLNVRCEKEESRMIPRLLAQGSGRMDLLFTTLEKTAKEKDLRSMGVASFT